MISSVLIAIPLVSMPIDAVLMKQYIIHNRGQNGLLPDVTI